MRRLSLVFVLMLFLGGVGESRAHTVYQTQLPSLTGVYTAGSNFTAAQAEWSIPARDGTVALQSMALHYDSAPEGRVR